MTDRNFKRDNIIFSYIQKQCLEFGLSFCETGLDLQSANVPLNSKNVSMRIRQKTSSAFDKACHLKIQVGHMWLINASLPCRKKCLISCLFKVIYSTTFKGKPALDKCENILRGTVKHACLYYTFRSK